MTDYLLKIQDHPTTATIDDSDDEEELFYELTDEEESYNLDEVVEDIADEVYENEDQDHQPIYPGAQISIGAFMLLLAVFCTRHNITGEGIQQLLNIISLLLPAHHILCASLHAYKQFFKKLRNPLVYHYYCHRCLGAVDNPAEENCPNEFCQTPFQKAQNYFLEIPVINQLQNLFSQDGFFETLQERFGRNVPVDTYEDIYDGKLYRSYLENNGPLNYPENISFTFNTDGASVFKSSNFSIWPIYLVINELPYNLRMKKENMILAALWFGNQKPLMATFLRPFLDSMKALSIGIKCFAPGRGEFVCKAFVMCGTADLPARSLLCNSNQYNGAYSCWKCLQKGGTAKVGKGHSHIFPFMPDSPKEPPRTSKSLLKDAMQAVQDKKTVNGIKGPTWLMVLPKFDILHGISIDYMHGVALGVQKLMLRLWFSPDYAKFNFSVSNLVCDVDEKLKRMRPTLDISRLPRSVSTELKYWKASEFRSFLLFYGAVVLKGILNTERFSHYLLLVNAMHILLKCGSTENELCYAEHLLLNFYENFANLYKECFMTLNLHQLLHLVDSVRYLGPLYTHSCFSFENNNGFLLKMIRGTQSIDNQITTGISFIQKLPELRQKCISRGTKEEELYELINSPYFLKRNTKIGDDIYTLGSIKDKVLSDQEFSAVVSYLGEAPLQDTFPCFKRIEINKMIIYGLDYKRMTKRDNSAISFMDENSCQFGRIRYFIRLTRNNADEYAAMLELLLCNNYHPKLGILCVKITGSLKVVPVRNIKSSCLFSCMDFAKKVGYVCFFPNRLESD